MMHPRFTLTPLFEAFLETVSIEQEGSPSDTGELSLVCQACSETLCLVEPDDTLAVLLRTALAHDIECPIREAEQIREDQP